MLVKFRNRGQAPHTLSGRLAPERGDEVKWYNALFQKPPNSTIGKI